MSSQASSSRLAAQADFTDGLGVRVCLAEKNGEQLEMLRLAPEFSGVPAFETRLRERVTRLANFRHAYYSRVRRVDRLDGGAALGVVSERPSGARLSHVLAVAERHRLDLDINAALCLVRQLLPAVAMLHQNARDVSHGALAPERIIITPLARIVITDYVLGSAIEELRLSRERLWRDLRIAVPSGAGSPRLDHRADVMQVGVVALALVLGRPLGRDELRAAPQLVASATEATVLGDRAPLSPPLRRWLTRALQADPRAAFESASQAQQSLEEDVLSGEGGYIAAPIALETFLTRYQECAVLGLDDLATAVGERTDETAAARPPAQGPAPKPPAPKSPGPSPPGMTMPVAPVSRPQPAPSERPLPAPVVLQPLADSPGPAEPEALPPGLAPLADRVAAAQHELSREVAAAAAAAHMFGGAAVARETLAPPVAAGSRGGDTRRRLERIALLALAAIAVAQSVFIWWKLDATSFITGGSGTVSIESRPANAQIVVDGQPRGTTPASLRLPAGAHVLEIRAGSEARVLPITVKADVTYAQYVELPSAMVGGSIDVREPAGARVLVDGRLRGTVPVRVADLSPGSHEVVVEYRGIRTRRAVEVQAGLTTTVEPGTAPVSAPAAASGPPAVPASGGSGIVAIRAPYDMQVLDGGRPLGSTVKERFELAAGRHDLEIVSETLGFRTTRTVDVVPGRETVVTIELPKGQLTLAADPPAEVFVDGERAGETPILNMPVPIGPHVVTFRHPEFGEEHRTVTITAGSPAKLDVKFKSADDPVPPQ
jgi:hypothetical protein